MSRQQNMMKNAAANVEAVNKEKNEVREIYEGLCQNLPVLIRTCGLCQAIAFVEAQAAGGGERGTAYTLLKGHITSVLQLHNMSDGNPNPSKTVLGYTTREYALATQLLLSAWIYYKRFVKSVLKVEG